MIVCCLLFGSYGLKEVLQIFTMLPLSLHTKSLIRVVSKSLTGCNTIKRFQQRDSAGCRLGVGSGLIDRFQSDWVVIIPVAPTGAAVYLGWLEFEEFGERL